jgi:hypothetical protein
VRERTAFKFRAYERITVKDGSFFLCNGTAKCQL